MLLPLAGRWQEGRVTVDAKSINVKSLAVLLITDEFWCKRFCQNVLE